MILIVAEKPSVARDIARVLKVRGKGEGFYENEEYLISWALGHLVALCDPHEMDPKWKKWSMESLPMLPSFMPTKVLPKTKKQFGVLKKLMNRKDVSEIICATDSGREGELIFRLIYQQAGCKKSVKRLWISSMTDEAIKDGFANLKDASAYDDLYESAKCRSEADWLVGMNASRAFTLRYGALLSIGRVQTPTLAILVKRKKEIDAFTPTDYYEVTVDYGDFTGIWTDLAKNTTHIDDQAAARAIAAKVRKKQAQVTEAVTEQKKQAAPQLYDLTSLQKDANGYFGISAAKTLEIAQSLYEKHKVLTYPRTDSRYLPNDMYFKTREALEKLPEIYAALTAPVLAKNLPKTPRIFNDSKVSDHHAIIPTGKKPPASMTEDETKIFDLVARRLIAAFYPAYVYDSAKIVTVCEGECFVSRGTQVVSPGWKEVYANFSKKGEDEPLPAVSMGQLLPIVGASSKKKQTKPPVPHTEASLLSLMENAGREIEDAELKESLKDHGLGTPATRAAIIERLIRVGYVARRGKTLLATDKGEKLIDAAPQELASPETTGKWERALERIRRGEMDPAAFMGSIHRFSAYLVDYAKTQAPDSITFPQEAKFYKNTYVKDAACPLCGEKVLETRLSYCCAKWKGGCKFTIWKDMAQKLGGPLVDAKIAAALLKNGQCIVPGGTFMMQGPQAYFVPEKKEEN